MYAGPVPTAGGVQPRAPTAKIAHMAITPQAENGVGDLKRRASITSGGLVIQRPPTWITTAMTSTPPIQRCARRAR